MTVSEYPAHPRLEDFFFAPKTGVPNLSQIIVSPRTSLPLHRILNEDSKDDDDVQSVFVDEETGEAYDPYSLAWRYLGMYLDCDVEELGLSYYYNNNNNNKDKNGKSNSEAGSGYYINDDGWNNDDQVDLEELGTWYRQRQRNLESKDNSNDSSGDCTRKVLWAAYRDQRYRGNAIGEYQLYNFTSGDYTSAYCANQDSFWSKLTQRCVRMDCHEPNTHYKLVGVFKESDGLVDWAEQLFKHQGSCLWAEDDYETMEGYRTWWPSYCRQLYYTDYDGNTLYMDLRPQSEGNIGVGIYSDDLCVTPSSYTFSDYILMYYSYYGYQDKAYQVIETWETTLAEWNQYMNVYKVCQSCRAYDVNEEDDNDNSQSGSQDNRGNRNRWLEENDGEGKEEPNGYNCYDAAGYTNCNQCYKFETKTDMEPVNRFDLEIASAQRTILEIKVNGTWYGQGNPYRGSSKVTVKSVTTTLFVGIATLVFLLSILYLIRALPMKRMLGSLLYWMQETWSKWSQQHDSKDLLRENYHIETTSKSDEKYKPPSSLSVTAKTTVPIYTPTWDGNRMSNFIQRRLQCQSTHRRGMESQPQLAVVGGRMWTRQRNLIPHHQPWSSLILKNDNQGVSQYEHYP